MSSSSSHPSSLKHHHLRRWKDFRNEQISLPFDPVMYANASRGMEVVESSAYKEHEIIQGLTLYDIYRQPRKLITKSSTSTFKLSHLNSELTCPICLGIIKKTLVVMECLHRFCTSCITKCLRLGKKECPSCRIHVPSRRSLRHDENFDKFIQQLYPNLEEYEENQEKIIAEDNRRHHFNNAFTEGCKQGLKNQEKHRRLQRKRSSTPTFAATTTASSSALSASTSLNHAKRQKTSTGSYNSSSQSSTTSSSRSARGGDDENAEMDFVLRKHPLERHLPDLVGEYLRTSKQLKISHMKKFLRKKLQPVIASNAKYNPQNLPYQITIVRSGHGSILGDDLTLEQVWQMFRPPPEIELVLHFRLER